MKLIWKFRNLEIYKDGSWWFLHRDGITIEATTDADEIKTRYNEEINNGRV